MRYWPLPSVTTERAFSISAGLLASTVTPGSTAPDGSLTTPVIDACANTAEGTSSVTSHARTRRAADRSMKASHRLASWRCLLFVPAGCCERQRERVATDAFPDLLHAGCPPCGHERRRPRPRQHLGILDDRLVFDRVGIDHAPALGDVQGVGMRPASLALRRRLVAAIGQPGLVVEAGDVDDERVAVPARDRVAEVGRDDVGDRKSTRLNS